MTTTGKRTLLITSMGSTAAQNLAHFLRREAVDRFELIGADARPEHGGIGLCGLDVTVPLGRDPGYAQRLVELGQEHGVAAVIGVMEDELAALSSARSALDAAGLRVLLSSDEALRLCRSKRLLMARFSELGIPRPEIYDPAVAAPLPLFAKPDDGTGSQGCEVVESEQHLALVHASGTQPVLMELLAGREHSVDGIAGKDGVLIHAVARTRDEVKGGLATRSEVVALPANVRSHVERLSESLGLFGFFNVQYFDVEGRGPVFTDLNPRLGGAMILSFEAGLPAVPFLESWLSDGPPPRPGPTRVGLRMRRRWHNLILD